VVVAAVTMVAILTTPYIQHSPFRVRTELQKLNSWLPKPPKKKIIRNRRLPASTILMVFPSRLCFLFCFVFL
jgi:hypothetical protein